MLESAAGSSVTARRHRSTSNPPINSTGTMRLADQAALITLGRLTERGIGIVAGIFLVRLLSKDDYGSYLQISLIGSLCASLILLGLPQSVLVFLPGEARERRRGFILQTVLVTGALSLLVGIAVTSAGTLVARALHNPALGPLALVIGLYTIVFSMNRLVEPTLIALRRAGEAGVLAIFTGGLLLVATVAPAWLGWGVGWIYLLMVVVYLGRIAYFAWMVTRIRGDAGGPLLSKSSLRDQARFAIPLGLAGITGQYNRRIDGLMVSFLFAPAVYAVYARGAFELPLVELLPFTLATVILPRLVELWKDRDRDAMTRLWSRSIRISALLIFPTFAYCYLFAHEIIVILFTEAYSGSVPVFEIYLLALPFRLTSYGVILQALGDTKTILRSNLYGLALNLALAVALCPAIGPQGAAVGYVASQLFQIVYLFHRIRETIQVPLRSLIPWSGLARTGGIVLVAGIAVMALGRAIEHPILRLLATGPPFLVLCALGYLWAGLIGPDEKEIVRRWARLTLAPFSARTGDENVDDVRPTKGTDDR